MARENFASRTTAILAMAGSAIGLGNIWRFPYMVGQNGGAAFIIVYMLSAVFICVPIFLSESWIGKKTQLSTFGALSALAPGTKWSWIGILTVFTPLIILSYYSVVGGWSLEYLLKSLTFSFSDGRMGQDAHSSAFSAFISDPWKPLVFHTLFMVMNTVIVYFGVKSGIEKFTKVTTPVLFVLMVIIMVYSLSMPGARAGVEYLLMPDFSKLTGSAVLGAMGQAFFSLSLGVGCILTYASYMKKEEKLLPTALYTAGFDMVFALIAGFAIMPAVFAAGIEPGAGPGLIFETLPYIFSRMAGVSAASAGATAAVASTATAAPAVASAASTFAVASAASGAIAILFFVAIFSAALTSSISMLEVGVAYLVDQKKMRRGRATILLSLGCWSLGVLCSLSFGPLSGVHLLGLSIFDFCDRMTSDFLMTFGSLLFVLFVGWKMDRRSVTEEIPRPFYWLIRYVAPVAIIVIFLTTLLG